MAEMMDNSKNDLLQQLLDHLLCQDTPQQRMETQKLLANDLQARQLYQNLQQLFRPLETIEPHSPPPGLADRTLEFIRNQRAESPIPIRNIDNKPVQTTEQGRGGWIMANIKDIIVAAACIGILMLTARPGLQHARQQERKQMCASQMRQIGTAIADYVGDNKGYLPYVKPNPDAVWWDVGKQDSAHHSNTRNLYLLIKSDYLPDRLFVCPNVKPGTNIRITLSPEARRALSDFPSRSDVNYSFRLMQQGLTLNSDSDKPLLTDQNPLFAEFDSDRQKELDLDGQNPLLRSNSPNHNQQGQNVLHNDGHVRFYLYRTITPAQDDMFTIKSVTRYLGKETPQPDDIFIAP